MTDDEENAAVAEVAKQLEAEAIAAEESAFATELTGANPASTPMPSYPAFVAQQQEPAALPISDLRQRLALLQEAGVIRYRDAGIEIQLDPDAKRKQPTAPIDGRNVERF